MLTFHLFFAASALHPAKIFSASAAVKHILLRTGSPWFHIVTDLRVKRTCGFGLCSSLESANLPMCDLRNAIWEFGVSGRYDQKLIARPLAVGNVSVRPEACQ